MDILSKAPELYQLV